MVHIGYVEDIFPEGTDSYKTINGVDNSGSGEYYSVYLGSEQWTSVEIDGVEYPYYDMS